MNPLLSFWIKVQPLSGGFSLQTWKAISQSSALATSSGDDTTVQRTSTASSWAFDYFMGATNRLASHLSKASSSWLLNPMITRMQDAPILKPTPTAICEGYQRYPTRKVDTSRVDAARFTTKNSAVANTTNNNASSALQQSQQLMQHQDFLRYQIQPLVRRNSKEWVREYKKERIDKINFNNVFGGMSETTNNDIPTLPPPASESDNTKYLIHPDSPSSSSAASTNTTPDNVVSLSLSQTSPTTSSSTTKVEGLCSNDVICGRGGKANTHPGNIAFREEAKKLRSWYESSSKSEKFTISSFLVDVVREKGGRFLKRDPDQPGRWLEADSSDVRKKASQALREGRRSQ
mmetsp:Transcript_23747/g.50351  ORF Transcript_23747/g.50351 Transcript_23747/m.50351 type:complete len:347 (-) Transcript_23747:175-1215(-)